LLYFFSLQIRLDIELTARRCLAYLSGGQIISLLQDILYPNEKECFCTKYRVGYVRIGEALKSVHPKAKAAVLNAIRQSGFTKEDLRELDWTFSTHLWDVGNFSLPGWCAFYFRVVGYKLLGDTKLSAEGLESTF
jgi:hypothetical protein